MPPSYRVSHKRLSIWGGGGWTKILIPMPPSYRVSLIATFDGWAPPIPPSPMDGGGEDIPPPPCLTTLVGGVEGS